MYKILLVDDEPPFLEELDRIVSEYGKGCMIVGKVYSGRQAFDLMQNEKPDIVFTDIRMPVMDGIEFARKVHETFPDTYIVVISGYSSFDYAREAFRAEVFDYLLKPIEQEMVNGILDKLTVKIRQERYEKRRETLKDVFFTEKTYKNHVFEHCYNNYCLVLVNSPLFGLNYENIGFSNENLRGMEFTILLSKLLNENEDFWILYKEAIGHVLLFGFENYRDGRIKNIISGIHSFFNNSSMPVSVGVSGNIRNFDDIRNRYCELERAFYKQLVIGKTQIISALDDIKLPLGFMTSIEEGRLTKFINERNWEKVKAEIVNLFSRWEKESCPSYCVKKVLKQIINLFEKQGISKGKLPDSQIEKSINEVMQVAKSFGELLSAFWNIVSIAFINENGEVKLSNSSQTFNRIEEYIKTNIARTISLMDISEAFGVSQSYICNLFRNRTGMSFIEYITGLRLEKAKELLMDSNLNIKDIGELVGYTDQHYFSRVFKNLTGLTPSAYQKSRH